MTLSSTPHGGELTLRDIIGGHLADAAPRVLCGHDRLDQPVRWVHSSEIYEIGPLLTGGELLLTTGLGLRGLDGGTRRHYVKDLAERGVAALAMEVGRTFDAVPDEMVREGSACRLPIIELTAVTPFIDVCRAVNTAVVARELDSLRTQSALADALHADLAAGSGVAPMLAHLGEVVGAPVVLVGAGGALLSTYGVDDDPAAWRIVERGIAEVPVTSKGRTIARLVVGEGSPHPVGRLDSLLQSAAGPVAVGLTRTSVRGSALAARLVEDLVDGRPLRRADLESRLAGAGISMAGPTVLVPVVAEAPDPRMADAALAAARTSDAMARSIVDATVYALVAVSTHDGPAVGGEPSQDPVDRVADALAAVGTRLGRTTVVVGDPCRLDGAAGRSDVAGELTGALRRCAARLAVAERTRTLAAAGRRVFTARELLADEVIRDLDAVLRSELNDLVRPLVAHDARASTQLVRTLAVHLTHGCSATRSAAALHIGRQSLYQRLERIREVLGFDPTAPAIHASMLLALRTVVDTVTP